MFNIENVLSVIRKNAYKGVFSYAGFRFGRAMKTKEIDQIIRNDSGRPFAAICCGYYWNID